VAIVRIVSTTHDGLPPATTGGERAPTLGARQRSPVEVTAGLLRGRWTAPILWHLFWGGKSFYQLLRELDGVSRQALAHELEDMEKNGLVARFFQRPGPARVEYVLTGLGESLKPVVGVMYEWGLKALDSSQEELAVEKQSRCPRDEH
jgi:DNA-binding HxlR family transcriptional regulator